MQFLTDVFYIAIQLLNDIYGFFMSMWAVIPEFVQFLYVTAIKWHIEGKILMVEISYSVARSILVDYEVYTFISNQFNRLPDNLAYSAHSLGIVDAIRIIVDALATAFVLRVSGW